MRYFILILIFFSCRVKAQNIQTSLLNEIRTYEVTAIMPTDSIIIVVWMEAREERKISSQAGGMCVAYKFSTDLGQSWSAKQLIDDPELLVVGNPHLTIDSNGNTYLVLMKIKPDFFSGNLSFYEWNQIKNKFEIKSIPAITKNSLLDKPAMAICGNKIHLAYVEMNKTLDSGKIKIQSSQDDGTTWSEPETLFPKSDVIALGVSLACINEELILTYGSYWQDSIYFTKARIQENKIEFPYPETISKVSGKLVSAMTEVATNGKDQITVGWQPIHEPNEIYISSGKDTGNSWTEPFLLSKSGSMLSMAYDKYNNLHLIYNEFLEDQFSVLYKKIEESDGHQSTRYILSPAKMKGGRDYIGAFQKILITENDIVFSFWIDFSDGNRLYFTKCEEGN